MADIHNLRKENDTLTAEIEKLKLENRETTSHIWKLQPTQRGGDNTSDLSKAYSRIHAGAYDFIGNYCDDEKEFDLSLEWARKNQNRESVQDFSKQLYQWRDIYDSAATPDIELEILVAFILRYLHENIFDTVLGGAAEKDAEAIRRIASSLTKEEKLKTNEFVLRIWLYTAYHGLKIRPDIQKRRNKVVQALSAHLAHLLGFIGRDTKREDFIESIRKRLVEPAMSLHERFLDGKNEYHFDTNPYLRNRNTFSADLTHLAHMDLMDWGANGRKITVKDLNKVPTNEVRKNLYTLFTVRPGLMARRVGFDLTSPEPYHILDEQVVVIWNRKEYRKRLEEDEDGWISKIINIANSP
ncbi:hypothetical protein F4819DRAFT_502182 [Hypoxylon fuscum]|nr:hypothetical protein F4819DRAFT_502182 [Hypoxylon fuscum]